MDGSFISNLIQASESAEEDVREYKILSVAEVLSLDLPPQSWHCSKLVPRPGLIAISAPPGGMKTMFCIYLAIRLAEGKPLFDEDDAITLFPATEFVAVLFIEEENDISLIKSRLANFKPLPNIPLWFGVEQGLKFDDDGCIEKIQALVLEHNIKVIILDPFSSVHSLKDENSATQVSGFLHSLRQHFTKLGVTIIFIHHPAKDSGGVSGSSLRGSGDILAKVDSHITLRQKDGYLILEQPKLRSAAPLEKGIRLLFHGGEGEYRFEYLGVHDESLTKKNDAKEKILEMLKVSSLDKSAVLEKLNEFGNYSYGIVTEALKELTDENKISTEKHGRKNIYSLTGAVDQLDQLSSP